MATVASRPNAGLRFRRERLRTLPIRWWVWRDDRPVGRIVHRVTELSAGALVWRFECALCTLRCSNDYLAPVKRYAVDHLGEKHG